MAPQGNNKDAGTLAGALAKAFDAIRPATRGEAEDELRTAGVDPEAVGQRIKQLADAMLDDRLGGDALGATPPHRRAFAPARLAWSVAAALLVCVVGWALTRNSGGPGLLQQYRERVQRADRAQRDQPLAGRLPRAENLPHASRQDETDEPLPPTTAPAPQPTAEAGAPATGESLPRVDTTIPLPSSELVASGLIPGGAIAPGEVVTAKNVEAYGTTLPPGLQWAVRNGLQLRTVASRTVIHPSAYREATEQYSGAVRLAPDGASLQGYVAGLPFPAIDPSDRQAPIKIMWNYEYRPFATDDLEAVDFELESGALGENGAGMAIDRRIVFRAFGRLYYTGRLFVDPRPELPNPEGIRFRESLHPVREPVDLRGVGQTSIRHTDVRKADDTWLYLPSLRRVRRLSAAQRSDALWGQDTDPDSYFGFSGPVGGTTWRLIGESEVVGCLHAENKPVQWGPGSADFVFDDVWETRSVYVIEAESKLPRYAYGKRVLYIDKETWGVLFSDIYDRSGELWKVWLNQFSTRTDAATSAGDTSAWIDNPAAVMIDVQRRHATRITVPSRRNAASSSWTFNQGELNEDWFKIPHLIESGH